MSRLPQILTLLFAAALLLVTAPFNVAQAANAESRLQHATIAVQVDTPHNQFDYGYAQPVNDCRVVPKLADHLPPRPGHFDRLADHLKLADHLPFWELFLELWINYDD